MITRKARFAERHNRMAAEYLEVAKDYLNLGSMFEIYFDYFYALAKDHQAMCKYYGF